MSQSIPSFAVTRSDHPRSAEERAKILEKPGFGLHFTDHMVEVRWDKDAGWHNASVRAYGPLQLDPAALGVSEAAIAQFALRVPEGFVARMRVGDAADPLLRQVLPVDEEMRPAPGFSFDAVGDGAARKATGEIGRASCRERV